MNAYILLGLLLSAGALAAVVALWQFWLLYLGAMAIYRAHLLGRIPHEAGFFVRATVVVALLVDLVANYTAAVLVFRQWPQNRWELVTHRLVRYINLVEPLNDMDRLRKHRALIVCRRFLDPFDPNPDGHCTVSQGQFFDLESLKK